MQRDILVGEAFGLEGLVERVAGDLPAVNGKKDVLSAAVLPEGHVVAQPAFDPAALVVIATGAFGVILAAAFEAVDIEFPHVVPDPAEILNQLTVGHGTHLFPYVGPFYHTSRVDKKRGKAGFFRRNGSSQLFFRDFPLHG